VLEKEGFNIPIEYHVDVQDMFKTNPDRNHMDDMEKLAGMMIDKSYNRKMSALNTSMTNGTRSQWR
jgi:hypothetical protein